MSVKIRLSRHGRKDLPYYHIVVADSRAPRDGRFIERIGSYDPLKIPAQIEVDSARSIYWLNQGAQPSNTVRRILSYKGVLLRRHLLRGVEKGAFDMEELERRFAAWQSDKDGKIEAQRKELADKLQAKRTSAHEAEERVNSARAEALQKRRAEAEAAKAAAEAEAAAKIQAAQAEAAGEQAESAAAPAGDAPAEPASQAE